MFDFALTFQKAYCIRSAWKFIFFDIFRIVSTFENFKSIKISFVSTFGIYIVDKNIASVYFWKLNLKNNIFRVHFYWLVQMSSARTIFSSVLMVGLLSPRSRCPRKAGLISACKASVSWLQPRKFRKYRICSPTLTSQYIIVTCPLILGYLDN